MKDNKETNSKSIESICNSPINSNNSKIEAHSITKKNNIDLEISYILKKEGKNQIDKKNIESKIQSSPILDNKKSLESCTNIKNEIYINKNKNKNKNNTNQNQTAKKYFLRIKRKQPNLLLSTEKKECELCHKYLDSYSYRFHFNSHPSKILNWLYLGTFANARDVEELKRNNIKYILNVAVECNNKKLPQNINELHLKIKDSSEVKIIDYFEDANKFIDNCRIEGKNILVHCKFGISRSPSFIIAYLIKYNNFTVNYALDFIKEKRDKINPNDGFLIQLYKYEEMIKNEQKTI